MPRTRTIEEFWERVDASGDCWMWTGAKSPNGYGRWGDNLYAHRVSWEYLVGPIENGLHMDHLCRVRLCVNPDHLETVAQRVNTLRGYALSAQEARQTRCKRGHEFTPENTGTAGKSGRRYCRFCENARQMKGYYTETEGAVNRRPVEKRAATILAFQMMEVKPSGKSPTGKEFAGGN